MLNRRETLQAGATLGAALTLGISPTANAADDPTVEDRIRDFTGGAEIRDGKVSLGIADIAENGFTVPLKIDVESPMTANDRVLEVVVLSTGNPLPGVATFKFSALSGKAEVVTRIRLARTQTLIAIAKMSDGSFYRDAKDVRVTIGGCGA